MTRPPEPEQWAPDPHAFVADLEAKPRALERLGRSRAVIDAIERVPREHARILFLGMGSSRYAALDSARRLRAAGLDAVAEYASAERLPPADPATLVVAISATGGSRETVAAQRRYLGRSHCVALTETTDSTLAHEADTVIPLMAGDEAGGVACRTFQHTGLVLRALEAHLGGPAFDLAAACGSVARACADLLDRRPDWLDAVVAALDGPDGVHVIGPAERSSSVAQSALMFREGPRLPATASETGDWSHVDVYLTKTTDYRALLLTGSAWDDEAVTWLRSRGSTFVAVGGAIEGAALVVDYEGATDPGVAIHVETLVAELAAASLWRRAADPAVTSPSS